MSRFYSSVLSQLVTGRGVSDERLNSNKKSHDLKLSRNELAWEPS